MEDISEKTCATVSTIDLTLGASHDWVKFIDLFDHCEPFSTPVRQRVRDIETTAHISARRAPFSSMHSTQDLRVRILQTDMHPTAPIF